MGTSHTNIPRFPLPNSCKAGKDLEKAGKSCPIREERILAVTPRAEEGHGFQEVVNEERSEQGHHQYKYGFICVIAPAHWTYVDQSKPGYIHATYSVCRLNHSFVCGVIPFLPFNINVSELCLYCWATIYTGVLNGW